MTNPAPSPPEDTLATQAGSETTEEADVLLDELDTDYGQYRAMTRGKLDRLLTVLPMKPLPTLDAKQKVVRRVRAHLSRLDLRVLCPICEQPSNIKAVVSGGARNGVFQFDHSIGEVRTSHGGFAQFPAGLRLADAKTSAAPPE
jgi:hypothetical protein